MNYVLLDSSPSSYIWCADTTNLYGADFDFKILAAANQWISGITQCLLTQFETTGNQQSYRMDFSTAGAMRMGITSDGFTEVVNSAGSAGTTPALVDGVPIWTRWIRISSTGDFTKQRSLDGVNWTTVATGTLAVGQTLFNSNAVHILGARDAIPPGNASTPFIGKIYAAELWFDGVLRASPDFRGLEPGTTSFTDDQGNLWTLNGTAVIPGPGTLVKPYGYEFRGLGFGAQTDYVTEEVNGLFSMEARDEDQDKKHDHGVNPGALLNGKRIIAFDMKVKGTTSDIETKLSTLQDTFKPPRIRNTKTTEPFIFQRRSTDPKKVCYVRCTKRDFASTWKIPRGLLGGSVELQAPDPRIYSLATFQEELTLAVGVTSGSVNVTNAGDHPDGAFPTIEIYGPATNPIITNVNDDNRAIRLTIVLANVDALRIDVRNRKVEKKIGLTGSWVSDFSIVANDNQWWNLLPGVNQILYNRTGSTLASTMLLTWQHTWN